MTDHQPKARFAKIGYWLFWGGRRESHVITRKKDSLNNRKLFLLQTWCPWVLRLPWPPGQLLSGDYFRLKTVDPHHLRGFSQILRCSQVTPLPFSPLIYEYIPWMSLFLQGNYTSLLQTWKSLIYATCLCLNKTFCRIEKLVQIPLPDNIFFYHNPVKGKEECIWRTQVIP